MVTPFTTFSLKGHKDSSDDDFSVLVEFGAQCWLVLPEHWLRVHLQPTDVVFFRSNRLEHCTLRVAQDPEWEKR